MLHSSDTQSLISNHVIYFKTYMSGNFFAGKTLLNIDPPYENKNK